MTLELLPMTFAVCQLPLETRADCDSPFTFFARTDGEASLVCASEKIPPDALRVEPGWRCLRVQGTLDFSLVGILAKIAGCLADAKIPIFAVSTYDTDYVLIKAACLDRAAEALSAAGMTVRIGGRPDISVPSPSDQPG